MGPRGNYSGLKRSALQTSETLERTCLGSSKTETEIQDIGRYMGVSENEGYLIWVSLQSGSYYLGYYIKVPYFWKRPYVCVYNVLIHVYVYLHIIKQTCSMNVFGVAIYSPYNSSRYRDLQLKFGVSGDSAFNISPATLPSRIESSSSQVLRLPGCGDWGCARIGDCRR